MTRSYFFGLAATLSLGCGASPFAEVSGEVGDYSLVPQTMFWGGPFVVFVDQPLDCMDMAWVKRGTNFRDGDEAPLDENIVALLFTYESEEVVVQNTSLDGDAPVDARVLVTRDGALAVYKATSGELDVSEFTSKDHAMGSFDLGFDDGNLSGDFQVEWCRNLKTRY
jgi:hypothetical protein